mgnify:CR=1 FL=1
MADTTQQMAAAEEKKRRCSSPAGESSSHAPGKHSSLQPADPDSVPHLQTYSVSETDSMTLYILLNELRDTQDPFPPVRLRLPCRYLRFLRNAR